MTLANGILFTDQYQLTMAQLYFRMGLHEKTAQFDHFYRSNPDYGGHQAGYCINAGLETVVNWMQSARFGDSEIAAMRSMQSPTGRQLFADDFLTYLRENGNFGSLTVKAIPEGRVVHPNVPLTIVTGSLLQAQILETALLNKLNFQTLIATKAARIDRAGRNRPLLEFGMRRGHGEGVIEGTRAALIGGADFSSNAGVSHALGYQPKGTHAHSMVQLFMALGGDESGELEAFRAYADVYPDDCLLLVDTVNTLESGLPNAITVFEALRRKGHEPAGIRLDSGDLAYLAVHSAQMLDAAGFDKCSIVLSDSLNEMALLQILGQIDQEARAVGMDADKIIGRLVYGVGTSLITSKGASALGGVYKLVAVEEDGAWTPAIKISENPAKVPNPGAKKVYRVYDERGLSSADLITLKDEEPTDDPLTLRHPSYTDMWRQLPASKISQIEPLHETIIADGKLVYDLPSIDQMRATRDADLARLDVGVKRLIHPHIYHVSISQKLWEMKRELLQRMKV